MEKVILIGGSPTAGKSSITDKLAKELGVPWISTDTIRGQMRKLVRKEDYPSLFYFDEATPKMAVEFLNKYSASEIVDIVNNESEDVWKGVRAIIETDYTYDSLIIEGVAITPKLVKDISDKNKDVKIMFLIDEDKDRVRKTIFERGLWDDAKKYPDSIKEKEIDWVLAFNEYIKSEAEKYNLPVISVRDRSKYLEEIKKALS